MSLLSEHELEGLLNVAGAPIGQSGDDGAARKNLRVCCQHNRSHGAPGRKAGHEHSARIGSKCRNGVLRHLPDRTRLALAAGIVVRQEPGETISRIVRVLLLRIDHGEAKPVRE